MTIEENNTVECRYCNTICKVDKLTKGGNIRYLAHECINRPTLSSNQIVIYTDRNGNIKDDGWRFTAFTARRKNHPLGNRKCQASGKNLGRYFLVVEHYNFKMRGNENDYVEVFRKEFTPEKYKHCWNPIPLQNL